MKFTVFVIVAGLCLVAVNASSEFSTNNEEIEDYDYIIQDLAEEVMDVQPKAMFSFFNGMFSVFKKALRTIKGLNCTIKEVLKIETVTQDFIDNVHACGSEVSKKVQKLIDLCNDIINTCKDIFGINESICGNTLVEEDYAAAQTFGSVSGAKNAHKCFVKMLRKLQTLNKQIKHALKLMKQIKQLPSDTNSCINDAINTLESYFTEFPANIEACSKLTS